jgi:hypothetical protein
MPEPLTGIRVVIAEDHDDTRDILEGVVRHLLAEAAEIRRSLGAGRHHPRRSAPRVVGVVSKCSERPQTDLAITDAGPGTRETATWRSRAGIVKVLYAIRAVSDVNWTITIVK